MHLFRRIRLLAAPTPPALLLPQAPSPCSPPAPSTKTQKLTTSTAALPARSLEIPIEISVDIKPTLASSASLEAVNGLLPRNARFTGVVSPALLKLATTAVDKSTGRSFCHWAAATGHNVLVSNLAALDADPNTSDRNGHTALHTTILLGLPAGVATPLTRCRDGDPE